MAETRDSLVRASETRDAVKRPRRVLGEGRFSSFRDLVPLADTDPKHALKLLLEMLQTLAVVGEKAADKSLAYYGKHGALEGTPNITVHHDGYIGVRKTSPTADLDLVGTADRADSPVIAMKNVISGDNTTLEMSDDGAGAQEFRISYSGTGGWNIAITDDGHVKIRVVESVIADADLENRQLSFWYDSTGPAIKVKHKDSGGTVRSGTVATIA